jgi:glycosyltransferase involved in cell wall biosynthesis
MTGVDRFAMEVINAIDSMLKEGHDLVRGCSVRVLVPAGTNIETFFKSIKVEIVGRFRGHIWEQCDLPLACHPEELLVNLCNTAPVARKKQIVVIHDAATNAMPEAFTLTFRTWYKILMPLLWRQAQKVLTVSEFSRKELQRAYRISPKKMEVIAEGGEHILRLPPDESVLKKHGLKGKPYVFAVSSMAAQKNFKLILDTYCSLKNPPFEIAIAGGVNSRVFDHAGVIGSNLIKWLGFVSDEELRALYENAMCFIFPSIYEGFGIPPLEAMHCGTPVLASSSASIPEVCGMAALYFHHNDSQRLATLLLELYNNSDCRHNLADKGKRHVARFSWRLTAEKVIRECLSLKKK